MDLALSSKDRDSILRAIVNFFPGASAYLADGIEELIEHDEDFFATVFLSGIPGFETGLNVSRIPGIVGLGPGFGALILRLAKHLSAELQCDVMCDAGEFAPSLGPYWSIVWKRGEPYLADDSECDASPPKAPRLLMKLDVRQL